MNLRALCAAAGILLAAAVPAHEFWLMPTDFAPEPGDAVGIRIELGEPFRGEEFPRDPAHSVRFAAVAADGSESLVQGVAGARPAGVFRAKDNAPRVLAYESSTAMNSLPHEKFLEYLVEEGYPALAEKAKVAGSPADAVTEEYSRCAKSLIGDLGAAKEWPSVGLALEIVPLGDPTAMPSEARFRVLDGGKPLADAPFFATAKAEFERRLEFRTDADGTVTVPIDRAGPWLVTSIAIQPHADQAKAGWRSHWSSLTFEVRYATPASPGAPPRRP